MTDTQQLSGLGKEAIELITELLDNGSFFCSAIELDPFGNFDGETWGNKAIRLLMIAGQAGGRSFKASWGDKPVKVIGANGLTYTVQTTDRAIHEVPEADISITNSIWASDRWYKAVGDHD